MPDLAVQLLNVSKVFPAEGGGLPVTAVKSLSLDIANGEFFTLLGPSGCGKTTTLRMIAGFEEPGEGEILIDGQAMNGVAPNHRPVNTVFQNYALFPHLTVVQNVAFGLTIKRVPRLERLQRAAAALDLVRLPGLETRRPDQLSGGQQQRVALARALVNQPSVLLLDEPLGALDLKLRKAVQIELKHLQERLGITFIYVTHDQEEALTMSNRIAVMKEGVVQQVGTPREIYEHPANRFVADFIGETNFLPATIDKLADFICLDVSGLAMLGSPGVSALQQGQAVTLAIRPEKFNLYPPGRADVLEAEIGLDAGTMAALLGGGPIRGDLDMRKYLEAEANAVVLDGRIEEAIYIGTDIRYRVRLGPHIQIIARVQNFGERYDQAYAVGDKVLVHYAAENGKILTE